MVVGVMVVLDTQPLPACCSPPEHPSCLPAAPICADAAHDGDGAQCRVQHGHVPVRLLLGAARKHAVRACQQLGSHTAAAARCCRCSCGCSRCCFLLRPLILFPPRRSTLAACSPALKLPPSHSHLLRSWLDLFAGTGAVGIEALSRGVGECHFVEMRCAHLEVGYCLRTRSWPSAAAGHR